MPRLELLNKVMCVSWDMWYNSGNRLKECHYFCSTLPYFQINIIAANNQCLLNDFINLLIQSYLQPHGVDTITPILQERKVKYRDVK